MTGKNDSDDFKEYEVLEETAENNSSDNEDITNPSSDESNKSYVKNEVQTTNTSDDFTESDRNFSYIVYGLYIAGVLIMLLPIIGLIMAYIKRNEVGGILQTHLNYCIGTFWKASVFWCISLFLIVTIVLAPIAWVVAMLTFAWYLARCIKGIILLSKGQSVDNPRTWLW